MKALPKLSFENDDGGKYVIWKPQIRPECARGIVEHAISLSGEPGRADLGTLLYLLGDEVGTSAAKEFVNYLKLRAPDDLYGLLPELAFAMLGQPPVESTRYAEAQAFFETLEQLLHEALHQRAPVKARTSRRRELSRAATVRRSPKQKAVKRSNAVTA